MCVCVSVCVCVCMCVCVCVCVATVGRTSGSNGEGMQYFWCGNLLVNIDLEVKRRRFEVNMKMCLGKLGCEGGKWTEVKWLQGSVQ